ncbi:MAG: hypothetical protein JSU91_02375 [Thermoplasmatales archaeon]|nr:MAG: hypothetical protein JSU91_02375 [Thermoplasmatales archaeon]
MNKSDMRYMKKEFYFTKIIRTEILFTPLLIGLPLVVGFLFIYDWYFRGILEGTTAFDGEFVIGIIIIIGNIAFGIPFIKSLKVLSKKK